MELNPTTCPTCKNNRTPLVLPNGDYQHSELYCSTCSKSEPMTKQQYEYFYTIKAQQRRRK